MSDRYANPFMIRSDQSTQTPLIGIACRACERSVDGIFAPRGGPKALGPAVARP